ncbi:MAG: PorT family protein [Tannerellaceae bacterium]|nr:PorT family protein [Tannerellaceae bacterium]
MRGFFILIAGLALVIEAGAQTTFRQEFSAGASFGMGVSSVSFVPKVQENQLLGVHTGLTVRWLTETFAGLVLEINYSQEGWDEHFDDPAFQYTRRLNYVDIPFLAHFYFDLSKHVRFFVNAGPKIGFLLNESTEKRIDDSASPPIDEITGRPHTSEQWNKAVENKLAWGICGGPGFELRTGIGCFQLEGRYYYSLGDIFSNRKADYFPKSSTQVIFGKLTYLIPLKRKTPHK